MKAPKGNSIEDLMFLFGIRKKGKNTYRDQVAYIMGENAWCEGKNADANPFSRNDIVSSFKYSAWYEAWLECNQNC